MTIATEAPRQSRPELALDPIIVGLGMVFLAIWRTRRRIASHGRSRDQIKAISDVVLGKWIEARDANETLAAHTRRLADELFFAQAELQMAIGLDVDPRLRLDPAWNDLLCENGPLSSPETGKEASSKGIALAKGSSSEEPGE